MNEIDKVEIYSSNGNVKIGGVAETFDPDAQEFPFGFEYDVSLIKVSDPAIAVHVKPPFPITWLSQEGWNGIKFSEKKLFLLDDPSRDAKSIGLVPSQYQIVGQGVLLNIAKTRSRKFPFGKAKNISQDREKWNRLVARSLLYRIAGNVKAPGGKSGTPVCFAEEAPDGNSVARLAGFQSFLQEVSGGLRYEIEGDLLYSRLEYGRVAFFGAFPVPDKIRQEHIIQFN